MDEQSLAVAGLVLEVGVNVCKACEMRVYAPGVCCAAGGKLRNRLNAVVGVRIQCMD